MIALELEKTYSSAKTLVKDCVASRIHAKDATLYNFSDEAMDSAQNFMGWADLASNPPYPVDPIKQFAQEQIDDGLQTVVLVGEGGSTQASMTITKFNKVDGNPVDFRTLDSVSPIRLRELFTEIDPAHTLFVHSSKSGGTIEPRLIMSAIRAELAKCMPEEEIPRHLVAITDPGSALLQKAEDEGWLGLFLGEPTVGGRYSALSVFGLVPAALAGIDIDKLLERAREAEAACSEDAIGNPAIALAAFLYEGYLNGRDIISYVTQKRGRVLGLWIEQLVAESLGKEGKGILPVIEVDTLNLAHDLGKSSVVVYQTKTALLDEQQNFEMSLSCIDSAIPRMNFRLESVEDLAEHFVMWEYAIAMCGYLMKVCPFDQPDVASAKAAVLEILENGQPQPDIVERFVGDVDMGAVEIELAPCFKGAATLEETLRALFESVKPGDYFALNAFLPFTGEGRREALEALRHSVADKLGVVAALEVGPRYLHSTGQLQKGGANNGVFLIVSADEMKDIPLVDQPADSLGALAKAQASGDLVTLASRDRRAVHLHLPDNAAVTLRALAEAVDRALCDIVAKRKSAE